MESFGIAFGKSDLAAFDGKTYLSATNSTPTGATNMSLVRIHFVVEKIAGGGVLS